MEGMHSFLKAIKDSMADGEEIAISITRSGEKVDLLLIPKLSLSDDEVPDKAKQLRAALATPLAFNGMTLEEISADFETRLQKYSSVRSQGLNAFNELIDSIHDATADAKNMAEAEKSATGDITVTDEHGHAAASDDVELPAVADSQVSAADGRDEEQSVEDQGVFDYLGQGS